MVESRDKLSNTDSGRVWLFQSKIDLNVISFLLRDRKRTSENEFWKNEEKKNASRYYQRLSVLKIWRKSILPSLRYVLDKKRMIKNITIFRRSSVSLNNIYLLRIFWTQTQSNTLMNETLKFIFTAVKRIMSPVE